MGNLDSIHTEAIEYLQDGTVLRGYLAYDSGPGEPRPGVLVFPEWWGLNDYIEKRVRMLAELGYVVLGVDMYGEGRLASSADEAGTLMNGILDDMATGTARIRAAYKALCDRVEVDASRVGAIGYCFGGAMALHAARIGMDLRGVVSFHGALGSFRRPAPGEVQAEILVCHGAEDAFVSKEDLLAFKQEMAEGEVEHRVLIYPGASHGFTSPAANENGPKYGLPLAYDADADQQSWQEMSDFFARVFS